MANIAVGTNLAIDQNMPQEIVTVTAVSSTTFTAVFAMAHAAGATVVLSTDALLPDLITDASAWWIRQTGRGPQNNSIPALSPYVQPVSYTENYDGSGSETQYLRNFPIQSVASLIVNGATIPQSTGQPQTAGWAIDSSGKCLVMINPGFFPGFTGNPGWGGGMGFYPTTFGSGYKFFSGNQNVQVQYTAGFSGVPQDVFQAITEIVALTQKSRAWLGLRTEAMAAGGGTVTYDNLVIPKRAQRVLEFYSRRAIVG
jgi:hypothetical protein